MQAQQVLFDSGGGRATNATNAKTKRPVQEKSDMEKRLEFLEQERKRLLEEAFQRDHARSAAEADLRKSLKAAPPEGRKTVYLTMVPSAPPLTLQQPIPSALPLTLDGEIAPPSASAPPLTITAETELVVEEDYILGQGGSCVVKRGLFADCFVAVKIFRESNERARKALKAESELLMQMRHENIVELYGVRATGDDLMLVMEFMSGGSLWDALHGENCELIVDDIGEETSTLVLRTRKAVRIASGVASGLAYLHEHNAMHRDMKSPNVLLDETLRAKLCDFGISRTVESTMTSQTGYIGTPQWSAPEVFRGRFGAASDVWSLGCILYELDTRKAPFEGHKAYAVIGMIQSGMLPGEMDGEEEGLFGQLIQQCWRRAEEERPSARQCCEEIENMLRKK